MRHDLPRLSRRYRRGHRLRQVAGDYAGNRGPAPLSLARGSFSRPLRGRAPGLWRAQDRSWSARPTPGPTVPGSPRRAGTGGGAVGTILVGSPLRVHADGSRFAVRPVVGRPSRSAPVGRGGHFGLLGLLGLLGAACAPRTPHSRRAPTPHSPFILSLVATFTLVWFRGGTGV